MRHPRRLAYTLQEPLKEELAKIQKQIMVNLGVDEISEWCNRFVLVLKPNGKL